MLTSRRVYEVVRLVVKLADFELKGQSFVFDSSPHPPPALYVLASFSPTSHSSLLTLICGLFSSRFLITSPMYSYLEEEFASRFKFFRRWNFSLSAAGN
ncbi:hypothetical protein L2E82_31192 [Cichorium intybus]|uniref:Uncharacterized protein n=1 Tax=Cichorium intybus TaxID=13427 RepID=A0ACB9D2N0_CICIN|nr:hypothetical protein L2E82_31192 [Cichorium intybus]